jgi:hypothetical protein
MGVSNTDIDTTAASPNVVSIDAVMDPINTIVKDIEESIKVII